MARFIAFFTLVRLRVTFFRPEVPFKFNLLQGFHSVFHVTLLETLVSQYLETYRKIFYLLDTGST